jgi:hypothetical protein
MHLKIGRLPKKLARLGGRVFVPPPIENNQRTIQLVSKSGEKTNPILDSGYWYGIELI